MFLHVARVDEILRMQPHCKRAFANGLHGRGGYRISARGPRREAAIENCDRIVADPARKKPEARCEHVGARIVSDELRRIANAAHAQEACEDFGIGKRMATVRAGLRSGQILLDVGEKRAGDVRLIVKLASQCVVRERLAAIEDDETGSADPSVELFGRNNRRQRQSGSSV